MQQTKKDRLLDRRIDYLLNENDFDRDMFPNLWNLSSAFIYSHLPIPKEVKRPEFVFVNDIKEKAKFTESVMFIAEWNTIWESAQLRTDFFWRKMIPLR